MKKTFFFFTVCISFVFCKQQPPAPNNPEATPEIFEEASPISIKEMTYSRRRDSDRDIVQDLFNEAIEKDTTLHNLVKAMDNASDFRRDNETPFNQYKQKNTLYWNSVDKHIRNIEDSLVRIEIQNMFDTLKKSYEKRIDSHVALSNQIDARVNELAVKNTLMKLVVTHPMMHNYQRNELPKTEQLLDVVEHYDALLKRTEEYTQIKK